MALGKHEIQLYDMTHYEHEHRFLEGTGAVVLNRVNKKAFALSERADEGLFRESATRSALRPCRSKASRPTRANGFRLTTNVMMAIGEKLAVVCLSAIQVEGADQQPSTVMTKSTYNVLTEEQRAVIRKRGWRRIRAVHYLRTLLHLIQCRRILVDT